MLVCAMVGYLLGRTRGMGLQGFFMGLAFGPLGWGLILLWPTRWVQGPVPRDAYQGAPGPGAGRAGGTASSASADRSDRSDSASDRPPETGRTSATRPEAEGRACPRCSRPVGPDAGACPHCGNVLVPVRYRVNPG
jgi:hypothetical protein